MIGALGFVCLVLVALLILQFAPDDGLFGPPALQAVETSSVGLEHAPAAVPSPDRSSDMQTSLQDAYDEPMLAELAAFFDAVAFEAEGAVLPPALQTYAEDLVLRLNLEQEAYRAEFHAPNPDLADRRAAELQTLFLNAGLDPTFLTLTGRTGSDGIVVERS